MNATPASIVIFGITGDLARSKLIPALFDLFCKGLLEKDFELIGYGRKTLSNEEFSSLVWDSLVSNTDSKDVETLRKRNQFIKKSKYVIGELEEKEGYDRLKKIIAKNRQTIFFLSVHPELHTVIIKKLGSEKLLNKKSQVLIEKPFGESAKSAKLLDKEICNYINESQIYRIDHYLGKEALIQLVERRKIDPGFENALKSNLKEINISLWETKTVANRGAFYDAVGTLKDVGQNHLLQMVAAVVASKDIYSGDYKKVQKARAKAINSLNLCKPAVRAQYRTYLSENGVKQTSQTETFFSITAKSKIPITLSAGKALSVNRAAIEIVFKKPVQLAEGTVKTVTYSLNQKDLEKKHLAMEAYERVFLAALEKNQKLFCSIDESISGWKFVDAVQKFWDANKVPLGKYKIGEDIHIPKK